MFPWNIAKSAEAMFSRWAVKRVCKFLLKKKLGQFILGDIDLDQLDVQLGAGTIQLSDLALNVDYINQKFGGAAGVTIKEGSIGSLFVQMPWKGKGCQIEVDELELVFAPYLAKKFPVLEVSSLSSQGGNYHTNCGSGIVENDMVDNASTSTSSDVHEGVKTIAKMIKWLLTSFRLNVKKLIVAFDPGSAEDEKEIRPHSILVLRISDIQCGTFVSDNDSSNSDAGFDSFLGISRLTNFVKFQGALVELLQMDVGNNKSSLPCASGTTYDEWFSGCCLSIAPSPILTGEKGGFSGNITLNIPWKSGSLDIRKVDADVSIDPVKLRFQPSTVKWFLILWDSLKNLDKDGGGCMHQKTETSVYYNSESHFQSPTLGSAAIATDKVKPIGEKLHTGFHSPMGRESVADGLLPGSHLISDWVPRSINKNKDGGDEEIDFALSVDQFFECFDGLRNSQSALGSSGIWNWTCSVVSAITAASNLASGSLDIPSEQHHVETNLKATVAGISVVFSFHNEDQKDMLDMKDDQKDVGPDTHYLVAECRGVILVLQVCPQDMKFEVTLGHIELADYMSDGIDNRHAGTNGSCSQTHLVQHLQSEVEGALPPFALSTRDPELEKSIGFVSADFLLSVSSMNGCISGINCTSIQKDDVVKVKLLRTCGACQCQITLNSSSTDGNSGGSVSFSLRLPPFICWVNFHLVNMFFDLLRELKSEIGFPTEDRLSNEDVMSGSHPCVTTSPSQDSIHGNVFLPNARIILCFPFENGGDFGGYTLWNQFLALDFSPPKTMGKKMAQDANPVTDASSRKLHSSTNLCSLHLNVGNLDVHLVSSAFKDDVGVTSCVMRRLKFSSQKIASATGRRGCLSSINMVWQKSSVAGPWVAERAKFLATLGDSSSRNEFRVKGFEFASVTTVKDLEDLSSRTRQEIILSSTLFLHVHLSPVTVNLGSSQYQDLHHILTRVMDGLASDPVGDREVSSVSQTSILVECDSLELSISPDKMESVKSSMQKELPGSWCNLRLKILKFELLSASNIGGIKGADFLRLAHGEGNLWGSITVVPDQEFLLISCSNSTMKRGDGEGSNALSSWFAGSDIIHFSDPEAIHNFTSITVRCSTIIAVGGRLDWLDTISSFFSLPSEIEQTGEDTLRKGDSRPLFGASFVLNLVDIGLSYEPYLKNQVASGKDADPDYSCSANVGEEMGTEYVTSLLAASSFSISNTAAVDSIDNNYNIRAQDLGLLLCAVSGPEIAGGTYSVEHMHKIGYVKVAGEALVEAILRTNCKNGLLWEIECSESHIDLETCHDTSSGLIRLASQLQQLFAPDMEETIVHLQNRWNNVRQAQERNDFCDERGANSLTLDRKSEAEAGLMDEICEDAFQLDGKWTCHYDTCESEFCISLDGSFLTEACDIGSTHPRTISRDLPFTGPVPVIGLENSQTSFLHKDCFPEFIEDYCLSELRPLSELSLGNQSLNTNFSSTSRHVGDRDLRRGNSGWYETTSLSILENHILEESKASDTMQFSVSKSSTHFAKPDDFGSAKGRVIVRNISVRWRMYAGSDWTQAQKSSQHCKHNCGRDTSVCLELALSGMNLKYVFFPDGEVMVTKLSLSVQDFNIYDNSRDAPWKLVLGYYHSKDHPRESSSKALKVDLEAVRPDPSTPLEEYRLCIAFLPMLLHLHQSQLDFLISFFGEQNSSVEQTPGCPPDSGGSSMLLMRNSNFGGHTIVEEALLPYFQKLDIWPLLVRVDYTPCRVDLAALRSGKYVELVNLVPWKGVELQLKHVHAVGIYGWSTVCETILGEWLEDISQNQIHKLLQGLPTIRSMVSVGSGAAKLVSLPVKSYRKDHRLLKGMQRGTIAFLRSISLEAVGLGVHLAAGAHDILLQAECILTSIPPSIPWPVQSRQKMNIRSNQPKDAQQGIQQAYESLADGLGKSASNLIQTPLKKYQRGATAGSAFATAVRGAPVAALAPASAAARALHCAFLGVRNSLDPEHKKESIEKYQGPSQPREHA